MGRKTRREFLYSCAASLPLLARANLLTAQQPATRSKLFGPALQPFVDPLPRLSTLKPVGKTHAGERYHIRYQEFERPLHAHLPPARLWGFEGQYPGPVIEARRGQPVEVDWENRLPRQHLFSVDPHIHGAMPPAPAVRTVPHLHGARTPSGSDGLPEKWFTPGHSVRYFYPNDQQAATLWYHDHALGITRLNVYAGLSGFYLLRDQQESRMNLPSGDFEVPLILQDRTVDAQGQLVYAPSFESGDIASPGVWAPEFFGEHPVVNGVIAPFLEVEPRAYRLRVLNGANSRFFRIFFNLAKGPTDIPNLVTFHQIGSDGGFLAGPTKLTRMLLGPAERADLIVDFSALEGQTVTLGNDAAAPYPGWSEMQHLHAPLYELMQFRVTLPRSAQAPGFSLPPAQPAEQPDASAAVITRDLLLTEKLDAAGKSLGVRINAKGYDDPTTEIVRLGSTEKWRFINTTDDAHPMHLHLVQFRLLERQGFDPVALALGKVVLQGIVRPPEPGEAGWKDTIAVDPGETATILVRFEGYTGKFVYHCHMLEHEDNDMMRPFEVVE